MGWGSTAQPTACHPCTSRLLVTARPLMMQSNRFDCEKKQVCKITANCRISCTLEQLARCPACYPELNAESGSLDIKLTMFRHHYKYYSTTEAIQIIRVLKPAVQDLCFILKEYIKLLLVNPAHLATAERSFSSLRRLNTWLRNSVSQTILNSNMLCAQSTWKLWTKQTFQNQLQTSFLVSIHVESCSVNLQSELLLATQKCARHNSNQSINQSINHLIDQSQIVDVRSESGVYFTVHVTTKTTKYKQQN